MEEVQKFLKSCGVYYLATTEGDQPIIHLINNYHI